MKIKLINYPYKNYEVGEICDFGEEKNASLVSLQRAVWAEENKKESKKTEHLTGAPKVLPAARDLDLEGEEIADEPDASHLPGVPKAEGPGRVLLEGEKPEEEKHFLQNDLKVGVEQKKKKGSSKKSFWDTLK